MVSPPLPHAQGDDGGERLDLQFKDDGTTLDDLIVSTAIFLYH